ncbi:MAG: Chromate resistance protein ChrB [Dehalococcoidia bacterium]
MADRWLLLIYTIPAQPSRKRATVWREVKKAGAIYLRDGVCILPERPPQLRAFEEIAAKVFELGGRATLVRSALVDGERAEAVIAEAAAARDAEYEDILREIDRFRAHLQREREHREFTFGELQELEADVGKLQRWSAQVQGRDFTAVGKAAEVDEALARCEAELAAFADETYEQEHRES